MVYSVLQIRSVTDQPAAYYQHGVIGESEMNNLTERNQQPRVTKVHPIVICKCIANYCNLNNFKVGAKRL